MKRFIIAFIAAYIFLFVWGWLVNGVLLKGVYAETPNLWRSENEMMSFFHWIIVGQALVVFSFVMIYASGFGGGAFAGIQLGLLLENRSDRDAPWLLRNPTDSGKTDHLREYQRSY
jgi:hypothetical protein